MENKDYIPYTEEWAKEMTKFPKDRIIEMLGNALRQRNDLREALNLTIPYVKGAYECAFPDESENQYVLEFANSSLENSNL